ncbi:MAG: MBL fold metallo-hydrolase [Candidatus Methanomethylicia archaeon]
MLINMGTLTFRDLKIRLTDTAGVKINHKYKTICIDTLNPKECSHILYTHHHPKHFPSNIRMEAIVDKIISPNMGLKVKAGETLKMNDVEISVIEAYNRLENYPNNPPHPKGLGVGYLIKFGDTTLYHMGDTDLIDEILEIRERIHILLIPIGGGNVMNPEEAAEAVKSLKPSITIPIHFEEMRQFHRFRDMAQPYTQMILLRRC